MIEQLIKLLSAKIVERVEANDLAGAGETAQMLALASVSAEHNMAMAHQLSVMIKRAGGTVAMNAEEIAETVGDQVLESRVREDGYLIELTLRSMTPEELAERAAPAEELPELPVQ